MKFDITIIILRHLDSLRNNRTGRVDIIDIILFYFLPTAIAWVGAIYDVCLDRETYNASLALYAIFAALLLNVQVAIFGIFQRGWKRPEDKNLHDSFEAQLHERREMLEELNINVSYLMVISCLSVSYFIAIFALKINSVVASGIAVFLYAHFLLTLFMVIKRSYALFDREYKRS